MRKNRVNAEMMADKLSGREKTAVLILPKNTRARKREYIYWR